VNICLLFVVVRLSKIVRQSLGQFRRALVFQSVQVWIETDGIAYSRSFLVTHD
jgi:hypothetical protein